MEQVNGDIKHFRYTWNRKPECITLNIVIEPFNREMEQSSSVMIAVTMDMKHLQRNTEQKKSNWIVYSDLEHMEIKEM
jgi:hypothetical protein